MKDVSIIFVNYKTKDLTINAINSVIEKTEGLDYEIFVVDNNSQDGSIESIEQTFPNINIIKNPINAGFGAANNLAIKQAKGKYILCLNTDTLLINNAIKIMFDFMEKEENQNVGVCGGYLVDINGNENSCGGHLPSLIDIFWKFGIRRLFPNQYRRYNVSLNSKELVQLGYTEHIIGADIFFRKSVLDKVGLFDENYFMYREETDLCKRIKDVNFDIKLVQEANIIHFDGGSTKNYLEKIKRFRKSEFYYFQKHHPKQVKLVKTLYIILYLIDWLILRKKTSKELFKYVKEL